MKKLLKYSKTLVIALDVLIIPGVFFLQWLSDYMLSLNNPCDWTKVGALCGSCGGTHCVNSFVYGDFISAFKYNPLIFVGIIYLIVALVLLNLTVFLKVDLAKKILRGMFSLKALCIAIAVFLAFIIFRNIPFFIRFYNLILKYANN